MGDVIHVLPAITDAQQALPNVQFDFIVEESFQEIPAWHPSVNSVITVASRRWRKNILDSRGQIFSAIKQIRKEHYDVIIDAQGLGKSALISALAKGVRHGYDKKSIRESFASRFYNHVHMVDKKAHAIYRTRSLFAKTLGYEFDSNTLDYGISNLALFDLKLVTKKEKMSAKTETLETTEFFEKKTPFDLCEPYYIFFHGTTWLAKEWPEKNWKILAKKILSQGEHIILPWGNDAEHLRAKRIAETCDNAHVLPRISISELGTMINHAKAIVAVDTGLGHLSAALDKPTVSIYGPTDNQLIGTQGKNQIHLCATDSPQWNAIKKNQLFDYDKISADLVMSELHKLLRNESHRIFK